MLSSTPAPVTDLANLKNAFRARQVKITDLSSDTLTIRGEFTSKRLVDYLAIVGCNLTENAEVQWKLYETTSTTVDLLGDGFEPVARGVPLGEFTSGHHPYAATTRTPVNGVIPKWLDTPIECEAFELLIKHGYPIVASPPSNGIPLQDGSGILSIEAENGTVTNVTNGTWTQTADGGASGGFYMAKSGNFFRDPNSGPDVSFTYTASQDGVHDVYLRCDIESGGNSINVVHDGNVESKIISPIVGGWDWYLMRQATLTAGANHETIVRGRDFTFKFDKMIIQPEGTAAPTGNGAAESSDGVEGSENNVMLRMVMVGLSTGLSESFDYGNKIKYTTDPEVDRTSEGFGLLTELTDPVRRMLLPLNNLSESDRVKFVEMQMAQRGKPFLITAFPGQSEWSDEMHSMLAQPLAAGELENYMEGFYRQPLELLEA